jgi:hypothetical protein
MRSHTRARRRLASPVRQAGPEAGQEFRLDPRSSSTEGICPSVKTRAETEPVAARLRDSSRPGNTWVENLDHPPRRGSIDGPGLQTRAENFSPFDVQGRIVWPPSSAFSGPKNPDSFSSCCTLAHRSLRDFARAISLPSDSSPTPSNDPIDIENTRFLGRTSDPALACL